MTVVIVAVVVFLVDRAFKRRGIKLAARVKGDGLDPVLQTRVRFLKRLVQAAIVVMGLMIVLNQFTALDRFATSVLASGAIAAAVIGFAAQQSLGNILAGVLLAVTQPIRIGDLISFEDHSGVVEDIRLAHTYLRTGTDARVVVPNGRLAQAVVRNDSIVTSTVGVETELWLAHESDELRALDVIREAVPGATPVVKAVVPEGTVLAVSAPPATAVESAEQQSALLHACLRALRQAGLR